LHRYFEVLLRVPMDELRRRDTRGIYTGNQADVVGVDLVAEFLESPDLTIENHGEMSPQCATTTVIEAMERKGLL
jgi:adenylylsulfate kinase